MHNSITKTCLIICLTLLIGCTSDSDKANDLFEQASALIFQIKPEHNIDAKLQLAKQAREKYQAILDKYPATDLAVKLGERSAISDIDSLVADLSEQVQKRDDCLGDPDYACVYFLALISGGVDDPAYGTLAEAEAVRGDILSAVETAGKIGHKVDKARALGVIAEEQARLGDLVRAKNIFDVALEIAETILDKDKAMVFVDIANNQAGSGDELSAEETLQLALASAEKIHDEYDKAGVLVAIARQQANLGDMVSAKETLGLALAAAEKIVHAGHKARMLAEIAFAMAKLEYQVE